MGLCSENSPCSCISTSPTKVHTPCPTPDCCIEACDATITCENAVGPCGQVGTTDLTAIDQQLSGCGTNPPRYRLVSYDEDIFQYVTISSAGELKWVTKGPETVGKFGKVCYKIVCLADAECDCDTELSSNATVFIGVRDLCLAHGCEDCEYCDPCDGLCKEKDAQIKLNTVIGTSNISVNGNK